MVCSVVIKHLCPIDSGLLHHYIKKHNDVFVYVGAYMSVGVYVCGRRGGGVHVVCLYNI